MDLSKNAFEKAIKTDLIQVPYCPAVTLAFSKLDGAFGLRAASALAMGAAIDPERAVAKSKGELFENIAISAANHPADPPIEYFGQAFALARRDYLSFNLSDPQDIGSEGAAVAPSLAEAKISAALEKIERLAVQAWWRAQAPISLIPISGQALGINPAHEHQLSLYRVHEFAPEFYIVVALYQDAAGLSLGFSTALSAEESCRKAACEAIAQSVNLWIPFWRGAEDLNNAEVLPYLQRSAYLAKHYQDIFEAKCLESKLPSNGASAQNASKFNQLLKANFGDFAFVDLTVPDIGLKAARFVPKSKASARPYFQTHRQSPLI